MYRKVNRVRKRKLKGLLATTILVLFTTGAFGGLLFLYFLVAGKFVEVTP